MFVVIAGQVLAGGILRGTVHCGPDVLRCDVSSWKAWRERVFGTELAKRMAERLSQTLEAAQCCQFGRHRNPRPHKGVA